MTSIQLIRQYLNTSEFDCVIFEARISMHPVSGRPWHGDGYETDWPIDALDDLWKEL
jgi:hypothetical protein